MSHTGSGREYGVTDHTCALIRSMARGAVAGLRPGVIAGPQDAGGLVAVALTGVSSKVPCPGASTGTRIRAPGAAISPVPRHGVDLRVHALAELAPIVQSNVAPVTAPVQGLPARRLMELPVAILQDCRELTLRKDRMIDRPELACNLL